MGHQPIGKQVAQPNSNAGTGPPGLPIAEASQREPLHHTQPTPNQPSPSPYRRHQLHVHTVGSIHPIDHITSPALARISVAPSPARRGPPWRRPRTPIIHPTRARNAERGRRRCRRRRHRTCHGTPARQPATVCVMSAEWAERRDRERYMLQGCSVARGAIET